VANVLAPFGFSWVGKKDGTPPSFGSFTALVSSTNSTPIFRGDWVIQLNTGYVSVGAAGDGAIGAGVFWGCRYYSVSGKIPKWSMYWPGSDAAGTVEAFVVADPDALFLVQCGGASGAALPLSAVGQNADLSTATAGSTINGISGMALDDSAVGATTTLPFHIVRRFSDPIDTSQTGPGITGQNGADNTTPYNYAYVSINSAVLKAGQSGV
jgi:hypothetical protein